MIDTHTHLYLTDYEGGAQAAVQRAVAAGVSHLVFPGVNIDSVAPMLRVQGLFPDKVSIALGLHPTDLGDDWRTHLAEIIRAMKGAEIVAIGEVGMDYHWDSSSPDVQKQAFMKQLQMAALWKLPVIIHSRDALDDTLSVISEFMSWVDNENNSCGDTGKLTFPDLIFHSFTGSPDDVRKIRSVCDPYFGINGVVTFKNARQLPDAIKEIGLVRILLETDSPYLAPVPYRGRRNESAYLPEILKKVAQILEISLDSCDKATTANALSVFRNKMIVN